MENPMLDFEMEQSEKLKKAFFEGYEAGKKDAEYYALHCGDTDEPQTNADRIRQMSDDELAKEFAEVQFFALKQHSELLTEEFLYSLWLKWMKQERE